MGKSSNQVMAGLYAALSDAGLMADEGESSGSGAGAARSLLIRL
jgi:hypothetical protein